ncbi:MAG: nucleotide exchange factor GrpE [Hyphomicrobium sp.]
MADEDKNPDQPAAAPDAGARVGNGESAGTVAVLEGRIADLTDRLLRAHAEMDNLRKRTERDKEDTAKYAISKFAREVLAVGDNLQRAMAAVPPGAADADPALKALVDGVGLTEREFTNVLERNGVKRLDPEGEPFNPHQHQAMIEIDQPDVAAGTIVQVYAPGYVLEDRVLRPAMVVVARGGGKRTGEDKPAAQPKASDDAA